MNTLSLPGRKPEPDELRLEAMRLAVALLTAPESGAWKQLGPVGLAKEIHDWLKPKV